MDYEKLHKDTINKLQEMVNSGKITVETARGICADFVPESEDERIRKELIEFVKSRGGFKQEYIAWLEKQGEKPTDKIQLGKKYKCIASPRYSTFMVDKIYKPEDKFLCSLMNFCSDCFEPIEDGEQKPTDKVEPKFKIEEGKWYVCTQTYVLRGKIVVIKGQTYQAEKDNVIKGEDGCRFIDRHDGKALDYFRSWTIQDAKDGDVLADGNLPFIFKKIDSMMHSYAYCGISIDGGFKIKSEGESGEWTWMQDIKPATKEQRDTLMKAMADAGYAFDFKKKELKKIEQKSAWSEEDEYCIHQLIVFCENCMVQDDGAKRCAQWLKSLRPQSQWISVDKEVYVKEPVLAQIKDKSDPFKGYVVCCDHTLIPNVYERYIELDNNCYQNT